MKRFLVLATCIASFSALHSNAVAQPAATTNNVIPVNDKCPTGYSLRIVGQQIAQQGYSGFRTCVLDQKPSIPARMPVGAESIVKLWITCEGKTWTGAGAVVSRSGHILTAAHVGSACINLKDIKIDVGPVTDAYSEPVVTWTAKLVGRVADGKRDPSSADLSNTSFQDAALYRIEKFEPTIPVAGLAGSYPIAGDSVSIAGFSNMPFEYANSENTIAGISIVKSSLLSVAARRGVPFRLHTTSMTLPGLSGGPVLDSSGAVIGIHSSLRTVAPNHFTWATSVAALPSEWLSLIQDSIR